MKLEQCHVGKMVRHDLWPIGENGSLIWCDDKSVVVELKDRTRAISSNCPNWFIDEPKQKYGLYAHRHINKGRWVISDFPVTQEDFERLSGSPEIKYHFPVKFDADGLCELPE